MTSDRTARNNSSLSYPLELVGTISLDLGIIEKCETYHLFWLGYVQVRLKLREHNANSK